MKGGGEKKEVKLSMYRVGAKGLHLYNELLLPHPVLRTKLASLVSVCEW